MSPSATPATQNASQCRQVPQLPRETKVDVAMPRLPRKVPRCHRRPSAPKRTTRASPVPQVPHLPRKVPLRHQRLTAPSAPPEPAQCRKRDACHAKWKWMSPSATPATQSEGGCFQVPCLPRKVSVWQSCMWKRECVKESVRWCVTRLCVWKRVCDKVVCVCLCERWCVTKLCACVCGGTSEEM